MKKVLFTATVDSHILHFHIPYLKWFKEQGYEVHVATNGNEEIPYCDVKHKISFERNPIKLNNLKAIKQLKKVIQNEKFSIIHCHTPMGSVVTRIATRKARKKYNTKVIYTAHGFHFYKGAPILNWLIFYPIEKLLSYITDCIITINEEDYELAKEKFHAKDIRLVYGVGVDENKFNFDMTTEQKHEIRSSFGLKDDDIVMIYVAELNENKNQIMLIEIMKEIKDTNKKLKLLLVGKGNLEETYKNKVKEYNLEEKVIFTGYRKDVPKLLKISDLCVATSKREGLPVNIIEAMICKLPVVATDCRGHRDLVKNGTNGYISDINSIAKFKENILKVINEKKQYEFSTEKYMLDSVIKDMTQIYTMSFTKNG